MSSYKDRKFPDHLKREIRVELRNGRKIMESFFITVGANDTYGQIVKTFEDMYEDYVRANQHTKLTLGISASLYWKVGPGTEELLVHYAMGEHGGVITYGYAKDTYILTFPYHYYFKEGLKRESGAPTNKHKIQISVALIGFILCVGYFVFKIVF